MKKWSKIISTFAGLALMNAAFAQAPLTVDQAIADALAKNNRVQISRKQIEVSQNLATPGQAGLLPTVTATGGADYGVDDTRLQLIGNDQTQVTKGAESLTMNASVSANYTLYAGRSNANTYQQLKVQADLSDANSRVEVESIIMQVISAYYNVSRTQDNLKALQQTMALSEDRLALAEKQRALSGGSKVNLLNAQVDLNQDKVALQNAEQAAEAAQITLNQLLGRDLAGPVVVQADSTLPVPEDFEVFRKGLQEQNGELQATRFNVQSSLLGYKIARSTYHPTLTLGASYGYNRTEAEGSFLQLNQSNGLGINLNLSIPLYAGGTRKATVKNAQIQRESQELQAKETESSLESSLLVAYRDYVRAVEIVRMEEQNRVLNAENFDYTRTQYEVGVVTSTQFRQAQINLLLTKNNLNNVRYNLRLAEMELYRLSGRLVASTR